MKFVKWKPRFRVGKIKSLISSESYRVLCDAHHFVFDIVGSFRTIDLWDVRQTMSFNYTEDVRMTWSRDWFAATSVNDVYVLDA